MVLNARTRLRKTIDQSYLYDEKKQQLIIGKPGRKPKGLSNEIFREKYNLMKEELISWFRYLVYNVYDPDERTNLWINWANHFVGDHSNCVHPDSIDDNHVGRPKKKRGEFWVWEEAIEDPTFFDELFEFLKVLPPSLKKLVKLIPKI